MKSSHTCMRMASTTQLSDRCYSSMLKIVDYFINNVSYYIWILWAKV